MNVTKYEKDDPRYYVVPLSDGTGRGLYNYFGKMSPSLSILLPKSYKTSEVIMPWHRTQSVPELIKGYVPLQGTLITEVSGIFKISKAEKPVFILNKKSCTHKLIKMYITGDIRVDKLQKKCQHMKVWAVKNKIPGKYTKLIYVVVEI